MEEHKWKQLEALLREINDFKLSRAETRAELAAHIPEDVLEEFLDNFVLKDRS